MKELDSRRKVDNLWLVFLSDVYVTVTALCLFLYIISLITLNSTDHSYFRDEKISLREVVSVC